MKTSHKLSLSGPCFLHSLVAVIAADDVVVAVLNDSPLPVVQVA